MATIPLIAIGSSPSAGAADLWYVESSRPRWMLVTGSAVSAAIAPLGIRRSVAAAGSGVSTGHARLSDPRARGAAVGLGASRLSGTYHVRATGLGISSGRASLLPHGSLSVVWIMKVR